MNQFNLRPGPPVWNILQQEESSTIIETLRDLTTRTNPSWNMP